MTAPRGWSWWVGLVVGGALMLSGFAGALRDAAATEPWELLGWVVGLAALHDLVVAPLACAVGVVVVRRAPQWARPPLRAGLLAAAVAVLLLVPGLAGTAREVAPDNPSVQPADERVSLGLALLAVVAASATWALLRRRVDHPGE